MLVAYTVNFGTNSHVLVKPFIRTFAILYTSLWDCSGPEVRLLTREEVGRCHVSQSYLHISFHSLLSSFIRNSLNVNIRQCRSITWFQNWSNTCCGWLKWRCNNTNDCLSKDQRLGTSMKSPQWNVVCLISIFYHWSQGLSVRTVVRTPSLTLPTTARTAVVYLREKSGPSPYSAFSRDFEN